MAEGQSAQANHIFRILDRARAHCPQNGEAGRTLSEALEASEAMLKALGAQSRAMEHLRNWTMPPS